MMYVQCRILVLGVPKNVPAFHVTIFTAVSIPVVQEVVNVVVRYKVKKNVDYISHNKILYIVETDIRIEIRSSTINHSGILGFYYLHYIYILH